MLAYRNTSRITDLLASFMRLGVHTSLGSLLTRSVAHWESINAPAARMATRRSMQSASAFQNSSIVISTFEFGGRASQRLNSASTVCWCITCVSSHFSSASMSSSWSQSNVVFGFFGRRAAHSCSLGACCGVVDVVLQLSAFSQQLLS